MRRPLRSWSNLLGKLGLRVVDKPANLSRQRLSQRRLAVETLEVRSMMTINSAYMASTNTLQIDSDAANDTVTVGSVFDNGINAYAVTINGTTLTSGGSAVAAASLQHLIVNGNDGNDTLDLSAVSSTRFNSALEVVIDGGAGADTIKGSQLADRITGGTGNDSLTGNAGNDTYVFDPAVGNLGSDTITEAGGTGVDTLDFSAFTTAITVDLSVTSSQSISSGTLSLQLSSNTGLENVIGGSSNDTITGNTRDNVLTGGEGNDTLSGGSANDTLLGQGGNDTLSGGLGNDTLDGGTGDDSLSGDGGNDTYRFNIADGNLGTDSVTEAANADTDTLDLSSLITNVTIDLGLTSSQTIISGALALSLSSSTGIENVATGSGNDTLLGNSRNNVLTGNGGNDWLEGKTGNDTLVGGVGSDTYKFDASLGNLGSDVVTESANLDTDTLDFSSFTSGIAIVLGLTAVQTVRPGSLDLALSSGSGLENVLGGSGDDTITGNGRENVLIGGEGNDTLGGSTGHDTLRGQAGNDTLTGGTGNDTLDGGTGDDSLAGESGSDTFLFNAVDGNLGTDTIIEAANLDSDMLDFGSFTTALTIDLNSTSSQTVSSGVLALTISTITGIENAIGGAGDDSLTGNSRDNTLTGGAGDDTLAGGTGNDTYKFDPAVGNLGADTLTEAANSGTDTLDFSHFTTGVVVDLGSTASQTVSSGVLSLALSSSTNFENATGGSGNDTLTGNNGNNILIGNAGDDTLSGLGNNDKLTGGAGNDSLQGGTGNDTYYFSGSTSLGSDAIIENAGEGTDFIDPTGLGGGATLDLGSTSMQTVNSLLSLTLSSAIGIENLDGTNYDDTITGNSLVNIITGNGGNDIIDGGDGNDQLDGGAGNDTVGGGAGNDKITGGGGDDILAGGMGDDLFAFAGNANLGNDIIAENPGEGNDTADLSQAIGTAALNVALGASQVLSANLTLQVQGGENLEYATPSATGDSGDDTFTVEGEEGTTKQVAFTYVDSLASYQNQVYVYIVGQESTTSELLFTSNVDPIGTTVTRAYEVGTVLSLYIVQNGGQNSGGDKFYTDPLRNLNNQDHVRTTDFVGSQVVYNWEDLKIGGGNPNNQNYDGDFNDTVVAVETIAPNVDIDADNNNNGEITEADDENEDDSAYSAPVALNDDSDNPTEGIDHETPGIVASENNLTKIIIRDLGHLPSGVTATQTLHYDTSQIAIYKDATRATLVDDGGTVTPGDYYVEGKAVGITTITLTATVLDEEYTDEISIQVVKPEYTPGDSSINIDPNSAAGTAAMMAGRALVNAATGTAELPMAGPACECPVGTDPYYCPCSYLPTVSFYGELPSDEPMPVEIKYRVTYNGVTEGWHEVDLDYVTLGDQFRQSVRLETEVRESGHYAYSIEIVTKYSDLTTHDATVSGYSDFVVPDQPGMPTGWIAGAIDKLIEYASGILLVRHDRTAAWYEDIGGSYSTPAGSYSQLVKETDGSFTQHHANGDSDTFNAQGQMTSRRSANGMSMSYEYTDADGDSTPEALSRITDAFGRTTDYGYTDGLLSSVTDHAGRSMTYTLDSQDRIVSVTHPDPDGAGPKAAPVTTYTYDSQDRVVTMTAPGNITTTYTYDAFGGLASSTTDGDTSYTEAADTRQQLDSSVTTREAKQIDPNGNVMLMTLDSKFGLPIKIVDAVGVVTTFVRDDNGLVTQMTQDALGISPLVTDYEYDAKGNLTRVDHPDASFETWTYDATFSRVTSHTDAAGRVTTYSIDSATGDILSATVGSGAETATTSFTYTDGTGTLPPGLLLTVTDALGRVTSYTYQTSTSADDFGRLLAVTYAVGTADEATTGFEYDLAGNVTATIDELGRRTEYEFNALDQLTRMLMADPDGAGSQSSPEIIYGYCSCGMQNNVVDALGNNVVHYTFDDHHRVVSMKQAAVGGVQPTYTYTYDDAGNRLTETDPLGQVTSYSYDELNRVILKTLPDPDGAGPLASPEWSFTYDTFGNLESSTDPLGLVSTYEYNSRQWLVAVTETASSLVRETFYSYDASGLLSSITDALGRVTSFVYDTVGRLTTTTLPDPDGAGPLAAPVYTTTYDLVGNVLTETDALGNVTAYEYDARDRLVEITEADPDGAGSQTSPVTLFVYDDAGQLTSTTDALGRVTSYEYDNLGRLIKTTLADPDGLGGAAAPEYTTTYDAMGNVLTETDALGNVTSYEYDALYRLTSVTSADPDGAGPQTASVTSYVYDLLGQLTSMTDALDRVTSYTYDQLGRLTSTTLPDPDGVGSLASPVYATTYDAIGNVLTETDALGNVTTYEYDGFYRLITVTQADPDGAGALASPVSTFTYDLADKLLTTTDPLGRTTSYEYDNLGRVIFTTLPDPDGAGSLTSPIYETQYDAVGNVLAEIDALGQTTTYEYDNLYRLLTVTEADPDGAGPQDSSITEYAYNAIGLVTAMIDPLGRTTSYAYDNLNRVITTTLPDPDGAGSLVAPTYTNTYDAVGNVLSETDALGNTTSYAYDNLYRLITVTDQNGDDATYAYNKVGNLLNRSDAVGNTTSYVYDNLDRLTLETNQLSLTRTWAYDANGNLLSRTDRNGAETQYAYDALNRSITDTWLAGSTVVNTIELTYLANGLLASITDDSSSYTYGYDGLDRLISTSNIGTSGVVETIFSQQYDAVGRVTKVAASIDGVRDFQNDYAYDAQNRLTSLTQSAQTPELGDPTPHAVAYKRVEFDYNADSQYAEIRRFASTGTIDLVAQTAFAYDATGRLTGIAHGQGATELAGYRWTFDADNRVASFASLVDGTAFYTYDDSDQLTGEFYVDQYLDATGTFQAITGAGYTAAGQKNQAYQYDANGNRMRRTEVALPDRFDPSSLAYDPTTAWTPIGNSTTSESYTESGVTVTTTDDFNTDAASTNRLETDGTYDYSYDDQGNRSRRTHIANGTVTVYQWDSRNRLTQIVEYADATDADNEVDAIQTIAYRYDMFNRRIGKQVFDNTSTLVKNERFVWNGGNVALDFNDADLDGTAESTELSARYLLGQQVDQFFAQENIDDVLSDGETLWGLTDNLGTVRDLAAYASGTSDTTIVDHRTYSAFGELTSGDATLSRYGFTAQEYDADAGMYYYDNRWYDQNVGQFISPDPIQDDPTNDYRYVGNNPTNGTDPSGLIIETLWDIGSLIYDGARVVKNGAECAYGGIRVGFNYVTDDEEDLNEALQGLSQDAGELGEAAVDTIVDGVSTALPGVPAGASKAYRAVKGAGNAADVGKAVNKAGDVVQAADKLADGAKAAEKATEAKKTAEAVNDINKGVTKKLDGPTPAPTSVDCPPPTSGGIPQTCFLKGTLVQTEYGACEIQEINCGIKVWAYDHIENRWKLQRVVSPLSHVFEGDIIEINLGGEKIKATGNHPIWVVNGESLSDRPLVSELNDVYEPSSVGRWVEARNLKVGDQLLPIYGDKTKVEMLIVERHAIEVYNIEVEELHNYAVGRRGFLVHNKPAHNNALPKPRVNKLEPAPGVDAPHSTFKRDQSGNVTGHAEWDAQGFPVQRTDVTGAAHGGVPTPHTHMYSPPNVNPKTGKAFPGNELPLPKPATPMEIPSWYKGKK